MELSGQLRTLAALSSGKEADYPIECYKFIVLNSAVMYTAIDRY